MELAQVDVPTWIRSQDVTQDQIVARSQPQIRVQAVTAQVQIAIGALARIQKLKFQIQIQEQVQIEIQIPLQVQARLEGQVRVPDLHQSSDGIMRFLRDLILREGDGQRM